MNTYAKTLLATMLIGASGVVFAQTAAPTANDKVPRPKAPEWTETDTNRDGYLTKDELIPYPTVLKVFEQIDTDRDGRISEAEYREWINHK
jgi:hypothetical protein